MLQEVYLVRHAQPDRSLPMAYNIHPGPPLTPHGRRETVLTASWLAGRGIEYVFSSPFERASATADAIAERLDLPITYTEMLREGGPGESLATIQQRAADLLAQLDDGPLRSVALVSHGAVLLGFLRHTTSNAIDLRGHMYDYGNNTPTAGVWHGVREGSTWRWNLAFRPVVEADAVAR